MNTTRTFKRKIYAQMQEWKQTKDGSTALLIQGVRHVGKSTVALEFAKREYQSYIVVNFADAPAALWEAINHISDLSLFFLQLQFIFNARLYERKSVIIFDEIQKCPQAREAIKALVADHRYDYIETGVQFDNKKHSRHTSIRSEETPLTMYPMDYEEFRWALGDETTVPCLTDALHQCQPFGEPLADRLMRDFRLYMLIGGMPEVVNSYLDTNNLTEVDQKKREIIHLYLKDFSKIDPSGKLVKLFLAIPSQLTGHASHFMPNSVLSRSEDPDSKDELLQTLKDSMTVYIAQHVSHPEDGLQLHHDHKNYKLYMSDTGLFTTVAFWDKPATDNDIYMKLLSDKHSADLSYVYKNIVAQMLASKGNMLFYHTWPSDTSNHNHEIDFLLSRGNKLCPIEVKSSGYKSHKPLDEFCEKYATHVSERFLVYTKDLRKDGKTVLLPAFMTSIL